MCVHLAKKNSSTFIHNNMEKLTVSINRAWEPMKTDYGRRVYNGYRSKLSRVIATKCDHFEQFIDVIYNLS